MKKQSNYTYKTLNGALRGQTTTVEIFRNDKPKKKYTAKDYWDYDPSSVLNFDYLIEAFDEKLEKYATEFESERVLWANLKVETLMFVHSFTDHTVYKQNSLRNLKDTPNLMRLTSSLSMMYQSGKKICDILKLMKKQKLIKLSQKQMRFLTRFSETRNKIIEHNVNPEKFKTLSSSVQFLDSISTSLLHSISTDATLEYRFEYEGHTYIGVVNYYRDFIELQDIIKCVLTMI